MATVGILLVILLMFFTAVGAIKYKYLTKPFKILTLFIAVNFVLSILSRFFALRYRNNIPVIHIEAITTYIFLALVYYNLFKNNSIKKWILYSVCFFILLALLNALYSEPFNKAFPTHIFIPTLLLYVIFSLLFFYQMLQYPIKVNISRQSIFWFNIAVLFYSTTMFLNLGLTNFYAENNYMDYMIYIFWYAVIYIFYTLIGVSIMLDKREKDLTNA